MAGYDCLEAENSQQAHAIIVDRKPDLILLDWMLPGTSGIELARRLKRDELTGDIPIILECWPAHRFREQARSHKDRALGREPSRRSVSGTACVIGIVW